MGLFTATKKTVEELLIEQNAELRAKLAASEAARDTERQHHEKKEEEFFETQQDLIHTIMLMKGIPIYEQDEHGDQVQVKPVPSTQRKSWHQICTGKTLASRVRAETNRKLEDQRRRAG
jgi:hypothetical protein